MHNWRQSLKLLACLYTANVECYSTTKYIKCLNGNFFPVILVSVTSFRDFYINNSLGNFLSVMQYLVTLLFDICV